MTSNILGSIYATTISSEKFVIISNQNIELSGNVIMTDDVTINNSIFNINSLIPNVNNSASLGSTSSSWSNAYIRDISVNNNLQVNGNVKIGGILDVSNIYSKSQIDQSFASVYNRGQITASFENVYTREIIDQSFANVYTRGQIDLSFNNVYTIGYFDTSFQKVYTRKQFDNSYAEIYTIKEIDASFQNVYTRGYVDTSFQNVYTKSVVDASFAELYTIRHIDLSFANVHTRREIELSFNNVHTKSVVDTSFQNVYTIKQIDNSFQDVHTIGAFDLSFKNVYTIGHVDNSFNNVYTRIHVDNSFGNVYTRGIIEQSFNNVYTRSYVDTSFRNVYTRGAIDTSFSNTNVVTIGQFSNSYATLYTRSQADVSFVFKSLFDLSYNALAASRAAGGSSTVLTSITSNIIPFSNNAYTLGSTSQYWNNAYINNLRVSNRIEEKYLNDISYIYSHYQLGPLFGRPFFDATYNNTVSTIQYSTNIALNSDGTILAQCTPPNYGYINVYKYRATDASWIQLGQRLTGSSQAGNVQYIGTTYQDGFLNISDDGYRISTGMNFDNPTQQYGARIYNYNGNSWNIIGDLSGIENGTNIIGRGQNHVLSGDGNTIALYNNITNYPNQLSNQMGQVRVYRYQGTGTNWTRLGNDISGTGIASLYMVTFGSGLGISYDGNTIVASTRTYPVYPGMSGYQGIARVFKYNATTNTWNIIGEFLGPGTDVNTWKEFGFGYGGTQISGDGLTVSVHTHADGRIYIYKFNTSNSTWSSANIILTSGGARNQLSYDGNTLLTNNQEIWKYRLNAWVRITTIPALVSNLRKLSLSRDGSTFGYLYVDSITTPINEGSVKVYQITTNTNTCYGLAKDAYPSLNPRSSGDKAVRTWTVRTLPVTDTWWRSVCWSPELGIFVAVAEAGTNNNRVMTSPNGINWTVRTAAEPNGWNGVCWSSELRRFIAVANGGTNRVMTSTDGTSWSSVTGVESQTWRTVCWSKELAIFVALAQGSNRVITSPNGTSSSWTATTTVLPADIWRSVIWCPELNIFVAASQNGSIATSINGTTWINRSTPVTCSCMSVCWSPQLGIFVVAGLNGVVMTSIDGTTWFARTLPASFGWDCVCWSPELETFLIIAEGTTLLTSGDGINWTSRSTANGSWHPACWSPELGIFVAIDYVSPQAITSSLKGRPPTSYNVFDSSFNSIDQFGKWTFQSIYTPTMTVQSANVNSDDRLKHNEVLITNGLDVIDRLKPKFYQKTQTLLDASYNGDLSGYSWTYEAGLIAQEVLQIPDISFAVSGGDYYQETINYYPNSANYDISTLLMHHSNDISANYDISYNLITQAYSLNYNSIYVYIFAAIKELHAKVKAQETAILNRQTIINNCIARIEELEKGNQV